MRTGKAAVVVAAAVGLLSLSSTALSAHADGAGGNCGKGGNCFVYVPPGGGRESGGHRGGSEKPKPKHPLCSAFSGGVIVPPGTPREKIPGVGPDWIRIVCRRDPDLLEVWLEPRKSAEQIARALLAQVQLEPIAMGMAPKGADAMALVGLPVWLWVDRPARTTWGPATIAAGGVSLTARVESVVWDFGDGTDVSCGQGTVWHPGTGGAPSPTCGHTYVRQGTYTVRATSHWVARWSGFGRSGTIPVALSTTRPLQVGELQVIVTRG